MGRLGSIVPTVVPAGSIAQAVVTVHNTSVMGATPSEYTFAVILTVWQGSDDVIYRGKRKALIPADGTEILSLPFEVSTGRSGVAFAFAQLKTTDGLTELAYTYTATFTISVPVSSSLMGHVDLQGRPVPPDPSWITPLTVVFFTPGTSTVVRQESVITDDKGDFTITNVPSGTYDIGVKCPRSLSELVSGVAFSADTVTPVDFGILREGDANNDDAITGADYAFLHYYFGQTSGEALETCDFNRDGQVDGLDYSLLWGNFSQTGDMWGMWPNPV